MKPKLIRIRREVVLETRTVEDDDRFTTLAMDTFRGDAMHAAHITLLHEKLTREIDPPQPELVRVGLDYEHETRLRRLEIQDEDNLKLTQELQIAKDEIEQLKRQLALVKDMNREEQKMIDDFTDRAIAEEPQLRHALRRVVEDSGITKTNEGGLKKLCFPWCTSWGTDSGSGCDCSAYAMRVLYAAALRPDIVTSGPERGKDGLYEESLTENGVAELLIKSTISEGVHTVTILKATFEKLVATAKLVRRHRIERHINCTKTNCNVCEGGLELCVVCGGAEASLEPTCPGPNRTIPFRLAGSDLLRFNQHKYGCDKLQPRPDHAPAACTCGSDKAEAQWLEVTK